MTAHELSLSLERFALSAQPSAKDKAVRFVLLPGELLKISRKQRTLRVIAGEAWVSQNGKDHALAPGDHLELATSSDEALVSAEGQTLFLEVA